MNEKKEINLQRVFVLLFVMSTIFPLAGCSVETSPMLVKGSNNERLVAEFIIAAKSGDRQTAKALVISKANEDLDRVLQSSFWSNKTVEKINETSTGKVMVTGYCKMKDIDHTWPCDLEIEIQNGKIISFQFLPGEW